MRELLSKGPRYREPISYSWHQNFGIYYTCMWRVCQTMDLERGSRSWHSFWKRKIFKSIADDLKRRIRRHEPIFCDPDVIRVLSRLHENFVIVPADITLINYTFVCKRHYVSIFTEEHGLKAILQVLIYKALYDKSYLGSKTTMTSGEWTCLISFATAPLTCSERGGSEKFKMKIYVSIGIRTHAPPVHDRKAAAP